MNLLEETRRDLKENGKEISDIRWVGTREVQMPVDAFLVLADKEYDSSYGAQEVAADLIVAGDDWWLERHEYDGAEWWEFKTMPQKPNRTVIPKAVACGGSMWATLKEMNHPEGKYSQTTWDWEGCEVEHDRT